MNMLEKVIRLNMEKNLPANERKVLHSTLSSSESPQQLGLAKKATLIINYFVLYKPATVAGQQ